MIVSKVVNKTHGLFLKWVLEATIIVFGFLSTYYYGLIQIIVSGDPTKITLLIFSIYAIVAVYCGVRTYLISNELKRLEESKNLFRTSNGSLMGTGILSEHAYDIIATNKNDQTMLLQCRANELHDKHEIIWHIAGALVKIGLFGTLIGFIIALWPFFTLEQFTFTAVRNLLGFISGGIGVALYTTLAGITTSVLLELQAHGLEMGTNRLLTRLAHFTEVEVIPNLKSTQRIHRS